MRRRIGADDLKGANRVMRQGNEPGRWWVCDEYEVHGDEIVAKHPFMEPGGIHRWSFYRPLEDTPDLFLKLANMYAEPDFTEAALVFSHKYGGLGVDSMRFAGVDDKTSLSSWWAEAERAWVVLKLYEAALNHDWEVIRRLHSEHSVYGRSVWAAAVLDGRIQPKGNRDITRVGLDGSTAMVARTVQRLCRPGLRVEDDDAPAKVQAMWQFDNLLGAMYLQMFWLMTSDEALGRCEYCDRTIFLAATHPGGRKPRRNKRFCDDACRQANHRSKKT